MNIKFKIEGLKQSQQDFREHILCKLFKDTCMKIGLKYINPFLNKYYNNKYNYTQNIPGDKLSLCFMIIDIIDNLRNNTDFINSFLELKYNIGFPHQRVNIMKSSIIYESSSMFPDLIIVYKISLSRNINYQGSIYSIPFPISRPSECIALISKIVKDNNFSLYI